MPKTNHGSILSEYLLLEPGHSPGIQAAILKQSQQVIVPLFFYSYP